MFIVICLLNLCYDIVYLNCLFPCSGGETFHSLFNSFFNSEAISRCFLYQSCCQCLSSKAYEVIFLSSFLGLFEPPPFCSYFLLSFLSFSLGYLQNVDLLVLLCSSQCNHSEFIFSSTVCLAHKRLLTLYFLARLRLSASLLE